LSAVAEPHQWIFNPSLLWLAAIKGAYKINSKEMEWNKLESLSQLDEIREMSDEKPVLIFKHSTRCSISSMAWDRLKRNWKEEDSEKVTPYYLDLIRHRDISNQVERDFNVYHESPQIILVKDGKAIYDNSHMGISYSDIMLRV
jgi:bacillithiol system protein YtxJ